MPVNPSVKPELLNSPATRASEINDPQFENQQGYFPYNLTHGEYLTPLFGHITPHMHLDTVPTDRIVVKENTKTILNQINGNFLSTINQYSDHFFVPLRSCFPNNYEKLIPNPTKGSDLPNSALPQIPFSYFVSNYLMDSSNYTIAVGRGPTAVRYTVTMAGLNEFIRGIDSDISLDSEASAKFSFYIGRLALLAHILSRGQLLDYLGIQYDTIAISQKSRLQEVIDKFYRKISNYVIQGSLDDANTIGAVSLSLIADEIQVPAFTNISGNVYAASTISELRNSLYDIFEAGEMPWLFINYWGSKSGPQLVAAAIDFLDVVESIFDCGIINPSFDYISTLDAESNPFRGGHYLNITKVLAYQQCVAQYFTNDSVDNIFNSDLYMQLLRSTMFPSEDGIFTREPIFNYNGVSTEYDYITTGSWYSSLIASDIPGHLNRQYVVMTLLFLMRRSLRYGDYFATARPDLLAVGQLQIPIGEGVSPIDVTKNLLMQRYLNAVNYIGSGFMQYMASIYGVTPTDRGSIPRFIAHRHVELGSQITNNTADNQGAQTTNLVGFSDNTAFDVFIDDIGVIISVTTYDVLPIYTSGIDNSYRLSDRFDYFNPMLQNIGDQPIYSDELIGNPSLHDSIFGYTMRNSEYKFKNSRAHGAFVNSLPGFLLKYPLDAFNPDNRLNPELHISPDFIRDKPAYLDPIVPNMTGVSAGEYFHFVVACVNDVHCARKIQATPPVLF